MLLLPWVSKTEITGTCNTGFTFCLIPCFFILTSAYPELLDLPFRQYSSWFEAIGSCSLYQKNPKKLPWRLDSVISLIPSQKYTAIGMLGKATDTLDATGKVTEEKPYGKHKCIYTLNVIWRHKWFLS